MSLFSFDRYQEAFTFGVTFAKRITVVNPIASFSANRHATKVLIEIQEQDFVITLIAKIHFEKQVSGASENKKGGNA